MSYLLETLTIASPCQADWNTMQGTEQVRFCQQCQLNVYNLSGMTQSDAETLVQQQEGRLCVRFYQRTDGTVLTQDCPVGVKTLHRGKLRHWGSIAAAVTVITLMGSFCVATYAENQGQQLMGKPMMGEPTMPTAGQVGQGNVYIPVQHSIKPKKSCKLIKKKTAKTPVSGTIPTPALMGAPAVMGDMRAPRSFEPSQNPQPELSTPIKNEATPSSLPEKTPTKP